MMKTQIAIDVESTGVVTEVVLNDIPLTRLGQPGGTGSATIPSTLYALNGTNRLELLIAPGPSPSRHRSPSGPLPTGAVVTARLYYRTIGSNDPAGERTLLTLAWPSAGGSGGGMGPVSVAGTANLSVPMGPWEWQRAPVLNLSALIGPVTAILQNLHQELSQGGTAMTKTINQVKLREFCRAFGLDPQQLEAEQEAALSQVISKPGFRMAPLDWNALDLRLVADGRLVDVVNVDGRPPLRAGVPGTPSYFAVPLRLGVVQRSLLCLC